MPTEKTSCIDIKMKNYSLFLKITIQQIPARVGISVDNIKASAISLMLVKLWKIDVPKNNVAKTIVKSFAKIYLLFIIFKDII